jgi:hypothetical protein
LFLQKFQNIWDIGTKWNIGTVKVYWFLWDIDVKYLHLYMALLCCPASVPGTYTRSTGRPREGHIRMYGVKSTDTVNIQRNIYYTLNCTVTSTHHHNYTNGVCFTALLVIRTWMPSWACIAGPCTSTSSQCFHVEKKKVLPPKSTLPVRVQAVATLS